MNEFILLYELFAKSALKIFLVLAGMLVVFLTFPVSRTSRLFAAGVIGSFAGGLLIQVTTDQFNLMLLTASALSIGFGIALLPALSILGRLNQRLSEDETLIDDLYNYLKSLIKKKASHLVEPVDTKVKS